MCVCVSWSLILFWFLDEIHPLLFTLRKQLARSFHYFFAFCKIINNNLHFQQYQFLSGRSRWLFGCAVYLLWVWWIYGIRTRMLEYSCNMTNMHDETLERCFRRSRMWCDMWCVVKSNDSAAAWGTEAALFSRICGDKKQLHQNVSFHASWIGIHVAESAYVPGYEKRCRSTCCNAKWQSSVTYYNETR